MDSEKMHIIYTAEDIQKYLAGKLEPAEMHAMEKAALDDAFLTDAIEGYESMQEKDYEKQLALLKDNFLSQQKPKVLATIPATSYTMWKAAAAVLIICCGVAITYTLTKDESAQSKSIAVITTRQDSVKSTVAESGNVDTIAKNNPSLITNTNIKAPEKLLNAQRDQKTFTDSSFIYRPGIARKPEAKQDAGGGYVDDVIKERKEISSANAAPTNQNTLEQFEKNSNKVSNQAATNAEDFRKREAAVSRNFTAQVVGPDGTALPFANISISNENFGTYADAKGKFRLVSPDSLLNIEIKSAGYISRNYTLRSDISQNKIVLAEDELALKEKTLVAGKVAPFSKKRRAALEPDSVINAEPADGWNNYDTYINNNLSLSDEILQKKIHGEVAISFVVQSDGAITNLKIDKSLCDDCDEAALRVIKEGPRWKVKSGKKATAKVKVKF